MGGNLGIKTDVKNRYFYDYFKEVQYFYIILSDPPPGWPTVV